jgi:hypothetical protein
MFFSSPMRGGEGCGTTRTAAESTSTAAATEAVNQPHGGAVQVRESS